MGKRSAYYNHIRSVNLQIESTSQQENKKSLFKPWTQNPDPKNKQNMKYLAFELHEQVCFLINNEES